MSTSDKLSNPRHRRGNPRPTISRRAFTTRLGAALLAAPFVDLLTGPRRARAAGGPAKRLVVFFCPNGTIPNRWRPSGTETAFSFPAGSILEPLAKHQQQLVAIDGLEFKNTSNHAGGMAAMLTGNGGAGDVGGGMSVDQYVAASIGGSTRLRSLELGVETSAWGAGVQTRMSYTAAGQYAPPDDDPTSVYGRVFGAASGPTDPVQVRRQSIIDAVKGDLADLRARVGAEERLKLDQHLASIRELERTMSSNACSGGTPPTPIAKDANDNFPTIGKTQMDLLVAALACGATNVASLQWSFTVSPIVMTWLSQSDGHHTLSHAWDTDAAGTANFVQAERWFATQFSYLLDKLAAAPDPAGGSLLDSTLVLWCKEMGDGRLHVCTDVPMVLAGGGGVIRLGRYLKTAGASHTQLLVSVCHAMGLTNERFGNPALGTGPLAGL